MTNYSKVDKFVNFLTYISHHKKPHSDDVRAFLCVVYLGCDTILPQYFSEGHMPICVMTDCTSLVYYPPKEGAVSEDRHTAVKIARLRQVPSARPDRNKQKAMLAWCPSRCQLADFLTKYGLSKSCRVFREAAAATFHEQSAQASKRARGAKAKAVTGGP